MHTSHYSYRLSERLRGMDSDLTSYRSGFLIQQSYTKKPEYPNLFVEKNGFRCYFWAYHVPPIFTICGFRPPYYAFEAAK